MGAHEYFYQAEGSDSKIEKIYNALRAEDLHMNGHDAYSGDIGQTYGFELVVLPKGRLIKKAYKMISNIGFLEQDRLNNGQSDRRYMKAVVEAADYFGITPTAFEALAERYDDKWSQSAICLRAGRKMIFCGFCAS